MPTAAQCNAIARPQERTSVCVPPSIHAISSEPDWQLCLRFVISTSEFNHKVDSHVKEDVFHPMLMQPLITIDVFPWNLTKMWHHRLLRWTAIVFQDKYGPRRSEILWCSSFRPFSWAFLYVSSFNNTWKIFKKLQRAKSPVFNLKNISLLINFFRFFVILLKGTLIKYNYRQVYKNCVLLKCLFILMKPREFLVRHFIPFRRD